MEQFTNKDLEVIRTEFRRVMDVIDILSGVSPWHLKDRELYDTYMKINHYCVKITEHFKEEGLE